MITLYRSPDLISHWVAYSEPLGWVRFPAKVNGWPERLPFRGDTSRLARIPARLGFNTGFPHPDATPVPEIGHSWVLEEFVLKEARQTHRARRVA